MCPAIVRIKRDMLETFELSERITPETIRSYSVIHRIIGSILKLFAPLL
jgi:hypothetical protein